MESKNPVVNGLIIVLIVSFLLSVGACLIGGFFMKDQEVARQEYTPTQDLVTYEKVNTPTSWKILYAAFGLFGLSSIAYTVLRIGFRVRFWDDNDMDFIFMVVGIVGILVLIGFVALLILGVLRS